ncbi:MAG: tetraacyldisaccharide 4'-kinase [Hyphomicrobiaceae bacterium]|nr:tetraacyldisaccharide 4'-kinase [Hyphomicrobiaceae bacterium]
MNLDEPSWWYGKRDGDWRIGALRPAAAIYGAAVERRWRQARAATAELPVVCVGNFTAGGTGKTPLALRLAALAAELGGRPAFLSRGYGGSERGPVVVAPGLHHARDVGDEPLLLSRAHPTIVARDRPSGARLAAALAPRPSLLIMDDGLQNPSLAKALTLAVVDGQRGFGSGEVIPAGPLRAPLAFQFTLADAIVVNLPCPEAAGEEGERRGHGMLEYLRTSFAGPVLAAWPEPAEDVRALAGTRVVAFAGIGNPARFFDLLRRVGADVAEAVAFRDHQILVEGDALRLTTLARRHGARLVTTEKDWVRVHGARPGTALAEVAVSSLPARITLEMTDADRKRLVALLAPVMARAS